MPYAPQPADSPNPAPPRAERRENAAFRAIFDAAPCGMLLVEAGGGIVAANHPLASMFGYQVDELRGQRIELLLPERFRADHVALRDKYHAAPAIRTMGQGRDLTGRRKDGVEFPLEIGLSFMDLPQGRMTCASVIDITERKRSELRLREANAQLEEFGYVVSHDLRSPIRGIASLIEMVREDYGEGAPPEVLRNLDRMQHRVAGMEALIGDLLTYARAGKRTARLEPIFMRALMEEIVELEGLPPTMQVEISGGDEPFVGARAPLATVIRNLLANAVKHHDRPQGTIQMSAALHGNHCVIDVADDGPGIPEASQERAFRLFQTLSPGQAKGSGLGLAVVRRLVDGHGGAIAVFSRDGQRGTRFQVRWPRFARTDLDD